MQVLIFAIFTIFDHFAKFCTHEKFQNHAELSPAEFEIIFFLIFDQSMILILHISINILHISTYSNKISVFVTYLVTITLIHYRKIDIQ